MKRTLAVVVITIAFAQGAVFGMEKETDHAQAYYHYLLASQKELSRDLKGAIEEYKEALKHDPNSSEILSRLAGLYVQTDQIDEAVQETKMAIAKNPDNKEAHKMLGQIYMQKIYGDEPSPEDLKNATVEFQEVYRLDPEDEDVLLSLGQLYLQQDDYEHAAGFLSKYMDRNPDSSSAALSLASAYDHLQQPDKAIALLLGFQKRQPGNFYVIQQLADLYREKGEMTKALEYQKQVYDQDPDSSNSIRRYIDLLERTGSYGEAIKILEQRVQQDPQRSAWTMLLAKMNAKAGNIDRAESILTSKIQEDSDDFDLKLSLVQVYEDSQQYTKATAYLGQLEQTLSGDVTLEETERKSDLALVYSHLGYCEQKLLNYDQSTSYYLKSRDLVDPEDQARIDFYIALNYRQQKDWDKAIGALKTILDRDPKDVQSWELLSLVYEEKGDTRTSDEIIDQLIHDNPAAPEFVILKAERQQQREQFQESLDYLNGRLQQFPANDEIYFLLGAASERLKKIDRAEEFFKKAIGINPGNANALNYLGYMLIDHGVRLEESVEYIKRALGIDHDNGAFLDSLGWGYYKLNKLDLAEDSLRLAMKNMQDNGVVHDHLGDLYFKQGKFTEAIAQWELALKIKDKELDADQVRKKIDDTKHRLR
jgi:tetratricopeptide (TPR) repeat protein